MLFLGKKECGKMPPSIKMWETGTRWGGWGLRYSGKQGLNLLLNSGLAAGCLKISAQEAGVAEMENIAF